MGLAVSVLGLLAAGSAPAGGAATVKVWFLQGEQMTSVSRPGATAQDAVRQLLRGPTAAETKAGVEIYVPAGTKLRGVTVADGLATVDVSLKFGSVDALARQWLTFDPAKARVLG